MSALLDDEEIAAELARLPGWQQERHAVRRVYEFADFAAAMRFVKRVADLAEAHDHHPDISISMRRVTLTLSSHDAGGVTRRDFALAHVIDD